MDFKMIVANETVAALCFKFDGFYCSTFTKKTFGLDLM